MRRLYPKPNPNSKNYLEQLRLKQLHHDLVCLRGAMVIVRRRVEKAATPLWLRANNLRAWHSLTREQRIATLNSRYPDRVRRHAEALARRREHNRVKALAAYRAGKLKGHIRDKLMRAARRTLAPKPLKSQPISGLVKAAETIANRYHRRTAGRVRAKLVKALRRRLENSMIHLKAGQSKSKTARDLLGCDLDFLRQHLEKQFRPGMTWDNHNFTGWHVDHVRPLALFDLSDPAQRAAAFHFSNLQPLWAKENMEKGCDTNWCLLQ